MKLDTLKETVRRLVSEAEFPVVFWSAGKDSNLILSLAREVRQDVGVIWFRVGQDEALAKRLMVEWDLRVLSYAPASVYMLGNGQELSMVQEFSFGESRWPVVMDVLPGDKCSVTAFPKRSPKVFTTFDLGLVGWKASDEHWLKDGAPFPPPDGTPLDGIKLYAPLREWTDEEVLAASRELNLPMGETSDVSLCTDCFRWDRPACCTVIKKEIDVQPIDQQAAVSWFRQRFGLEAQHA